MNIKYDAIQRGVWVPCWHCCGLRHIWITQDIILRIPVRSTTHTMLVLKMTITLVNISSSCFPCTRMEAMHLSAIPHEVSNQLRHVLKTLIIVYVMLTSIISQHHFNHSSDKTHNKKMAFVHMFQTWTHLISNKFGIWRSKYKLYVVRKI
jgi:hypothetical protein